MNAAAQPRSILYINPTADLYGVSKMLLEVLKRLPREKYKPIVILPNPGPLENVLSQMQVEYHVFPISVIRRGSVKGIALVNFLLSILPNTIRLMNFIVRKKIDLVHTFATVILTGSFAAKLVGIPHIWHVHEIISEEFPALWRFYRRLIIGLSIRVICISNVTARQFPDRFKVRIIPDGINLEPFAAKTSQGNISPWGTKKVGTIDIGMIGRVSPRKGQSYLLDAYNVLLHRQKDNPSRLLIIGDTFSGYEYYLQDLKAKVKEFGLKDKVIFTGFIEDVTSVYPFLDIVVVPSLLPEGFGLVVLEAMASHLPVIATSHGGPLEIIENDISGMLVTNNNINELANAMAYLIAHPEERKRLGDGGHQRVKQVFNIEKTNELIYQTYRDILIV
jgi:glycosyltransferase involved in cell wall biosynthesis